ncbi:MAG: nucleotide exchange factor GrpE [Candidatus Promineifilaceae bacterium]
MNKGLKKNEKLETKEFDDLVNSAVDTEEVLDSEAVQEIDPEDRISELEARLAEAEDHAAEYLDGWQRARAEYANARKRLERERADAYARAAIDQAQKMLPILDDINRAMANVPEEIQDNDWFQGILLVSRKMNAILEDMNVKKIESVGQPFDPNFHEALALTEAEGFESGTVVEEVQGGYMLGDRVIRPALVNVAG